MEVVGEFYPQAQWQQCVVHFYRIVTTVVPKGKRKQVAAMLKAIHAQGDRVAVQQKADNVWSPSLRRCGRGRWLVWCGRVLRNCCGLCSIRGSTG